MPRIEKAAGERVLAHLLRTRTLLRTATAGSPRRTAPGYDVRVWALRNDAWA